MELREAVIDGARQAFCALTTPAAAAARYFEETTEQIPIIGGPLSLPPGLYSNARSLVCGTEPDSDVLDPGTSQEVGQCPTNYRWIWRIRYVAPSGAITDTTSQPPPTSGFGNGPILGPITGPVQQPGFPSRWRLIDGNGVPTSTIQFLEPGGVFEVDEFLVATVDGSPDDCGAIIPPPPLTPAERTINIPIDINGNMVNVDFTLEGPLIGVDGNLFVPIVVVGPSFNFDVSFNVKTGGISFEFGGGAEGPDCCPEAGDDEVEDRIIIGVVVNVTSAVANRYFGELPISTEAPIYGPYIGLIRFWRLSGGSRVYSADIPIKTTPQDVPCPFPRGAQGFVLDAQTDAVLTGAPYFAKVKSQLSE